MASTIQLKRSSVAAKVPTIAQLALGELAVNTFDGRLFLKRNDGTEAIVEIGAVRAVAGKTGNVTLVIGDVSGLQSALDAKVGAVSPQLSGTVLNDGYTEEVFAITDGTTVNLNPNNGSIQTWTLGANRTPGQANWAAGQSITLLIDDGSAATITWTTLGVVWKTDGGSPPALNTTGFTVISLWKVGATIYGARVGNA